MKVLVFGSKGLVGSSVSKKITEVEPSYKLVKSSREDTNLFSYIETSKKIKKEKPDVVIIAAAKVGGIYANNTNRYQFIVENLKINLNILEALAEYSKTKIINIGSSCIYPLGVKNPISEDSLMTGKLEPTNSPYSMAKLVSVELGKTLKTQFGHEVINLMPTNLYGPNDKFEEMNSHVIPGLIYKMHEAKVKGEKTVEIWGSGNPLREFMHVDDLASAIIFLLKKEVSQDILNIGSGEEVSIKVLANKIKSVVNFEGELIFNDKFPDGNPRKLLDSSTINKLGWSSSIDLDSGLKSTYEWYKNNLTT